VRGILDQRDPVSRCELEDRVHRAGVATVVQYDYRASRRRDRSFDVRHVEIEVVRAFDVTEDRRRANVDDRVRGRNEVQGRNDDLVTRGASDGEKREMQRGGPVRDRNRLGDPE